ncbi:MAG: ABC transporter permease [Clostridiales bacterium]|jgi:peptide/nickel transport system permease protein|nr:ABC transporter permease [Clostridiales bacterium]
MENAIQSNTDLKPKKRRSQFGEIWKRFKRNPLAIVGLVLIVLMFLMAALADVIAPGDGVFAGYNLQDWNRIRQFPSAEHWFGTDDIGRDVFSRVVHGSRISLQVGFVVIIIGITVGIPLGAIAGYYKGILDNVIMRFIDILLAVPNILLAIAIAAALGPGITNVMIAVGIGAIPIYARTVRAQVLAVKEQEFVEAARAAGANDFRIIRRHILPNCMAPVIVEASMGMAGAIMAAAGLSFIGLGAQAPTPEWGAMLADGRLRMLAGYWHLTLFPGLMIALIIFALNMMGDGLRDALDPKLRSGGFSKKRFRRIQLAKAAAQNNSGEGQ